jgi:ABC-type dipeptide/oligopeptide/nickel transport system permease component
MRKVEFIIRRVFLSFVVLIGLSIITFIITRVIPSDPVSLYVGPKPNISDVERVREKLGLNHPLPVQYAYYVRDLLHGDLGTSIASKLPVLKVVGALWPATLELLFTSVILSTLIGIPMGVISARLQGSPLDVFVRTFSIIGVSVPAFLMGLILQIIFFQNFHLLPLTGRFTADLRFTNPIHVLTGFYLIDTALTGNWVAFKDVARHIILPATALSLYPIGLIARMTRATMLEVLGQDYIRTARAYGIRETMVFFVDALKNAIGPTLTIIGLTLAWSLTGTFFVEIIFNWPGLGTFTVNSLLNLDYPAVMGITLLGAVGYVAVNLIVDLIQAWIDPRISLA